MPEGLEIAGHTFVNGVCIKPKPDGSPCWRRLNDIRSYGRANINEPDIAHVGGLSAFEADQIEIYVRKEEVGFSFR